MTDWALAGISHRCPRLQTLRCAGLARVSDRGLDYLVNGATDASAATAAKQGDSLRSIDLSKCLELNDAAIGMLAAHCKRLQAIELSGCAHLTDDTLHKLASQCPHLQRVRLARCKRLTDKSLCSLADYLWLEDLDFSGNNRITDDGIEVLAVEFSGLITLNLNDCAKLTDKSIEAFTRHSRALAELNVINCRGITDKAHALLRAANHRLKILRKKGDEVRAESDLTLLARNR